MWMDRAPLSAGTLAHGNVEGSPRSRCSCRAAWVTPSAAHDKDGRGRGVPAGSPSMAGCRVSTPRLGGYLTSERPWRPGMTLILVASIAASDDQSPSYCKWPLARPHPLDRSLIVAPDGRRLSAASNEASCARRSARVSQRLGGLCITPCQESVARCAFCPTRPSAKSAPSSSRLPSTAPSSFPSSSTSMRPTRRATRSSPAPPPPPSPPSPDATARKTSPHHK